MLAAKTTSRVTQSAESPGAMAANSAEDADVCLFASEINNVKDGDEEDWQAIRRVEEDGREIELCELCNAIQFGFRHSVPMRHCDDFVAPVVVPDISSAKMRRVTCRDVLAAMVFMA